MRTLYVRIIVTTMVIMISSAILAFIVTNVYYDQKLKPQNDEKMMGIASDIVDVYEENGAGSINDYLENMTELGYTFYLVNDNGDERFYGVDFDDKNLDRDDISHVLNGKAYHGIANYPWKLFITGFFNNELKNTVGVPIKINGDQYALFVRANTEQQFGEMRTFLSVLLVILLCISFALVLLSTRYVVRPIKTLTEATKKVSGGNYHLQLPVKRSDEIGELARHFTHMSNTLEEVEEKRQEFVSNVSHEIQSPLTSIQGFSQTLRTENLDKDEHDHYLEIIEKEARRLSLLSKQLLTLSMLDKDTVMKDKTQFNLGSQLKDTVTVTEWQWRENDLAIDLAIEEIFITGNQRLLHQVWMNLLTNAIRYTEPGGTITIEAAQDKNGAYITYTDTGIGIDQGDLPYLFDRFYKADKSRKRTETSTGLGLSIVKKIIEIHNGTIMVESRQGHGTTFTVILPK